MSLNLQARSLIVREISNFQENLKLSCLDVQTLLVRNAESMMKKQNKEYVQNGLR